MLAENLLRWYDEHHRELPWRMDKDPYKIWVSEIMLQQTRVEAVKEYYKRWLERFPTPNELAAANEEEVLCYWQGLGYYNRARNLHAGVREVCAVYGGRVPDDERAVQSLPGVGEYTAGAILSIAYGRRLPAVDGNVLRIFSRLFYIADDITKQATKHHITKLVSMHMSTERPGDFNQALMDLGGAVCIPQRPRCTECPVADFCEAYAQDVAETLPVKPAKKTPLPVTLAAGLVRKESAYLVRRRQPGSVLAGMWEFPAVEITAECDGKASLSEFLEQNLGQQVLVKDSAFHYFHVFSHRTWDITFYECQWQAGEILPDEAKWLPCGAWDSVPWAGPHRKVAHALFK